MGEVRILGWIRLERGGKKGYASLGSTILRLDKCGKLFGRKKNVLRARLEGATPAVGGTSKTPGKKIKTAGRRRKRNETTTRASASGSPKRKRRILALFVREGAGSN